MKEKMYAFLLWCSGSNPEIIERSPRSEQIKHAGYGTLVLIPSVLAAFAMTYAISTVTEKWFVYVTAGIVWAIIIFFADRFLVSSFRKANNMRTAQRTKRQTEILNLKHDIISFSFITRFILSAFIGVGIAHPMVLLYFQKDIEQIMSSNKIIAEKTIRAEHDTNADALKNAIASQEDYVKCLRKLLIYEQTDVKINTDCGSTSGIPGFKKRAETINDQLSQAQLELRKLYEADSINHASEENLKQLELAKYQSAFSNGYIARENALVQLENMEGSNAKGVKYFLIIFLILIDTLAVSWKAMAKRGPYDDYLNSLEDGIALETQLQLLDNETSIQNKLSTLNWKASV